MTGITQGVEGCELCHHARVQGWAPHAALQGRLLEVRLRQGPVVDDVLAGRLPPGRRDSVSVRAEAGIRRLLLCVRQLRTVAKGSRNCLNTSVLPHANALTLEPQVYRPSLLHYPLRWQRRLAGALR